MSSAKKDILVYVPDIPSDIADNDGEQMIQTRLQNTLSIKLVTHLKQAYKSIENLLCEPITPQIPNIFHVTFNTLDNLVEVANSSDFQLDGILVTVYPCANCSFLENLPRTANDDKLRSAVITQNGDKELSATSLYIQYNKDTGDAVILVSKSAKTWLMKQSLIIDGQNIEKKTALTCRILVSPVPRGFNLDHIFNDSLLLNRVIGHNQVNDTLILELNNMDTYKNVLAQKVIKIDNNSMKLKPYAIVIDPETMEIDAEN
ncbi:unnamed protein product [Rotaria magnacalcarata]|uniref:Uncharacterized protein n=2 Tax=Rotaria magnacalcarata TaxID=392030 RepID=A0A816QHM6_9BILA|nr:unnamed protein product [Rotaria magnacalcarata]